MFLLVITYLDDESKPQYFGPFPNAERAEKYLTALDEQVKKARRWSTAPMTVPYSVVRNIDYH